MNKHKYESNLAEMMPTMYYRIHELSKYNETIYCAATLDKMLEYFKYDAMPGNTIKLNIIIVQDNDVSLVYPLENNK